MSEFTCIKGHLMPSGELSCPECGGRLTRMDGMTARQLEAEDNEVEQEENNDSD
jgi:hypothetical protein